MMVADLTTLLTYGISDVGNTRANNEDAWVIHTDPLILIIADGIGGNNAGEVASHEAVRSLKKSVLEIFEAYGYNLSYHKFATKLQDAIIRINKWIHYLSTQDPQLSGMGTTLSCLIKYGDKYIIAHVGDSRIYRYRKDLAQLTVDHSLRDELFAKGKLSARQMSYFPFKHVITRTVGTRPSVRPEIRIGSWRKGDIFMLCSDGLSDYVSYSRLLDALETTDFDIEKTANQLVSQAKLHGSHDNITILMCKLC